MIKDLPASKPGSQSLARIPSRTVSYSEAKRIQRARSNARKMANLDLVVPSEREKLFFKFYMENGKSMQNAWTKLCQHEGGLTGTAHNRGRTYMKRPGCQRLMRDYHRQIAAITEKQLSKYSITKERVMEELVKLAFSNVTDTMSWNDNGLLVKASEDLSDEAKAAICDVQEIIEPGGNRKVRLKHVDKTKALELIGRQLGLFKEKVDHNHKHLQVTFLVDKG